MFDFFQWSDLNPGRLGEKRKCYLCAIRNQCYKSFTGLYVKTVLFLQSIIAPCVAKFNMHMVFFTFNCHVLQQKSMIVLN